MKVNKCIICDIEFKLKKEKQKCCSSKCSSIAFSKNLMGVHHSNCLVCNNGINRKNAKFCSKSCHIKYQNSSDNPLNKEIKMECNYCKKPFWIKNFQKNKRKFCSTECSKYGQNRPNIGLDNRINKICTYCGNTYKIHKYRNKTSFYCSSECKKSVGKITTICKFCKSEFISAKHRSRIFCSSDCSIKYHGPSKLEDFIYNILIDNIGYENISIQSTIKSSEFRYCVDFLIYDKIVLEVLGDYWHCNPRIYEDSYYHNQHKKTANEIRTHDIIKFNNLKNENYIVYSIWEDHDMPDNFNKNLKILIDEIRSYKK